MAVVYGRSDSEVQLVRKYPKEVKRLEDIDVVKAQFENDLRDGDLPLFKKWHCRRRLRKFRENENDTLHAGASGENRAIRVLSRLDNTYSVFCGLTVELQYPITYRGKKNLRSAQMDVVVVGRNGVFLVEVNNWCSAWRGSSKKMSPHEQTDRAGRVLKFMLKRACGSMGITTIMLPINNNIGYDSDYRKVFVTSTSRINDFITCMDGHLAGKKMDSIVDILKKYATS